MQDLVTPAVLHERYSKVHATDCHVRSVHAKLPLRHLSPVSPMVLSLQSNMLLPLESNIC